MLDAASTGQCALCRVITASSKPSPAQPSLVSSQSASSNGGTSDKRTPNDCADLGEDLVGVQGAAP